MEDEVGSENEEEREAPSGDASSEKHHKIAKHFTGFTIWDASLHALRHLAMLFCMKASQIYNASCRRRHLECLRACTLPLCDIVLHA